jgi:AcrR family transcriptional regulator
MFCEGANESLPDFALRPPQPSGRPPGRRERKKLDTRRRIFRAAIDLFLAKGFDATTVEEIAEKADVGKGTVFNYFPQKTSFLMAAYQEWVVVIGRDLGPVDTWTGTARAQLDRLFGYLTDLATGHRSLARQVIFENMRQAHLRMTREERKPERGEGDREAGEQPAAVGVEESEGESGGTGGAAVQLGSAPSDSDPEAVRLLEHMTSQVIRAGMDRGEIRGAVNISQAASLTAAAVFHTLVRGLVRGESASEIKAGLGAKLDIIFTGMAPGAEGMP